MPDELKIVTDWTTAPAGTAQNLDLTEDAWSFGSPPPHGIYDIKLFTGRDAVKANFDEDGKFTHYVVNIESKVVSDNEEYDGAVAFPALPISTKIARGKKISTAAGLIVKLGYGQKIPPQVTDKQLANFVEQLLKREPVIKAELDWRGSYSWKNAKGEDIWENVYNHCEDFPIKEGVRQHQVNVASKGGGTAEVRAQLRIVRFFGKEDKIPVIGAPTTMVAGAGAGVIGAPQLVSAPRTVLQPPQPMTTPTQAAQVQQPLAPAPIAHVTQQVQQPVNAAPAPAVSEEDISFVTE